MGIFSRRHHSAHDAPLLKAAERADAPAVRHLLQARADPDARDAYRYTPLMRAVSYTSDAASRGQVIDQLLAAGANVDAVEQAGQTALIHAAHADNLAAAHRLLAAGARVQSRASSGRDALHIAFAHGNLAMARALCATELHGGSARRLLCAVVMEDAPLVRRMLAGGDRSGAADASGLTPLHAASLAGNVALAEVLVRAGAGLDACDSEGVSPLIQAAQSGRQEMAAALCALGADTSIRMRTGWGDDALSLAAREGHVDVVRALLGAGAAIDASSGNGNGSALTAAVSRGRDALVALLLERGASVRGVGALCAAAASGSVEVVKRLLAAGADPNERIELPAPHHLSISPLVNAVACAAPAIVALLVEAGADVHARDARGDTALLLLAEITTGPPEQVDIARILLAAGADVNARGEQERTAFAMAKQNGNTLLAEALLQAGADETSGERS